jgi:hypothetical protein
MLGCLAHESGQHGGTGLAVIGQIELSTGRQSPEPGVGVEQVLIGGAKEASGVQGQGAG